MSQLDLFAGTANPGARINRAPLARRTDPGTSHAAAHKLTSSRRRDRQKMMVLAFLTDHPGTTSAELAKTAGLDRHLVAKRLPDLRADGLVRNGASRQCTVNQTPARTWRTTSGGGG